MTTAAAATPFETIAAPLAFRSTSLDASGSGSGPDDRSPYARAQDTLSRLVDAAASAQRIAAMHASVQIHVLRLAMDHAVAAAEAFTSPRVSGERRRDLAIRAVIAEFATAMRIPERTMQRFASDAWVLTTQLPRTLAAMRSGAFAMAHARVIIEAIEGVDDEAIVAELDGELAALSETVPAATLRRRARRLREELLAETAAERHRAATGERRVELEPAADGMAWLHLFLPVTEALLIHRRLDQSARSLRHPAVAADGIGNRGAAGEGDADRQGRGDAADAASTAAGAGAGADVGAAVGAGVGAEAGAGAGAGAATSDRTLEQLRADVAVDLLLGVSAEAGRADATAPVPISPTVAVTVPVMTLLGGDEPGYLEGYGPIDAESARRIAAHAPSFLRILTHPVTGAVLDVDRRSYRPPADLAKWVRLRDETCRFPGCNRNARACELDHTLDWADGGRTAHDNLASLCPQHHHLKHETSWSVRQLGDGVLEWRSPSGRRHRSDPAVRIRAGGAKTSGAAEPLPQLAPPF
ncbi:DUF222 domain-containing protein [Agromyces sp. CFH 90414]|uniref:DUF222 domain-containing protein n=1 Tax=Agromyces agglutinans TaxID=2662258 RepID=A0A6I2FDW7_9MICO|nr:HNH endonuclease signature motif containing protein [Agromyces agglutinans]MRG59288.1 DUF222 domain-containing protein [Agromyces agglutinans]